MKKLGKWFDRFLSNWPIRVNGKNCRHLFNYLLKSLAKSSLLSLGKRDGWKARSPPSTTPFSFSWLIWKATRPCLPFWNGHGSNRTCWILEIPVGHQIFKNVPFESYSAKDCFCFLFFCFIQVYCAIPGQQQGREPKWASGWEGKTDGLPTKWTQIFFKVLGRPKSGRALLDSHLAGSTFRHVAHVTLARLDMKVTSSGHFETTDSILFSPSKTFLIREPKQNTTWHAPSIR